MTARRIYVPDAQPSRDPNGRALPAKLYFYEPTGTYDTPKAVYTDNTLTTAHAFPVLSNAAGRFPAIWADDAETFDVVWADQVFNQRLGAWTNITPLSDAMVASAAAAEAAADEAEAWADAAAHSAQDSAQSANEAAAVVATLEGYTEGVVTNATNVNFTRSGAGAVVRSVKARLDDWVSVKDFGAAGDGSTNDTAAIQAAIDAFAANSTNWNDNARPGAVIWFPPGRYLITSTIILKAGVILQGAGSMATEIVVGNGANCHAIATEGYDSFVGSGLSYIDTSNVPTRFGLRDLCVRGNKFNNTSGDGVRIYGYHFWIQNVQIAETCGHGLISRWETGSDTFVRNRFKTIESVVSGLSVWNCNGSGVEWFGPTDAKIDGVFIGECGQNSVGFGRYGARIEASVDIGLMHVYACGKSDGSNTPIGVLVNASCRIESLISEHNYGPALNVANYYAQITNLQMYRNCRAYGAFACTIDTSALYFSALNVECKLDDTNHSGVLVNAPYARFGSVSVIGTNSDLTIYTGYGFRQANTAHYLSVDRLLVRDLRGVGALGADFNQGGATKGVKMKASLIGCTTGAGPGSGFSHGADVAITIEKATAAQAYSSFAFPAVTYGRQTITQISETGSGSAG